MNISGTRILYKETINQIKLLFLIFEIYSQYQITT